ncbi:MAG: putative endonuclease [Candidatus Dependentiae bacterium]|nr:putative endonuclease [Candidatus Dependentiae bacterium]
MHIRQKVGSRGESLAVDYLSDHGYTLVTSNFLVHHVGEIDLIMRHQNVLVCVEVKTRYSVAVPFEFLVPRSKQRKIIATAKFFVQRQQAHDFVVRFDVVFVDLSAGAPVITHIPNAFWV